MRERHVYLLVLGLLVTIGIAVRSWGIGGEPLWLDEAYSAFAANHDLAFLWRVVPLYETHPPFYYGLLHFWVEAAGDSLIALRAFGLLASFATLVVIALLAEEAGRWIGLAIRPRRLLTLVAVGFGSLSFALVEMARQVRPYPLMILVYACAILTIVRMAGRVDRAGTIGRTNLVLYLLLVEALLWLHNLGALYGLSLAIALGIALLRPTLIRRDGMLLIVGHCIVGMLYLPALFILRGQAATWTAHSWLRFALDQTFFDRVMTLYGLPGMFGLVSLLLAVLAIAGLRKLHNGARLAAMLLILALLPVILSVLLSLTVTPLFVTRIMTATAVPGLLLIAIGAAIGPFRRLGIACAILLGTGLLAGDIQTRQGGPMQDWYAATDWLARYFKPGDQVFAYPNEGKLPLSYALRDRNLAYPIRAIPADVPAFELRHGTHPTGTRGASKLPRSELRATAQEQATRAVPTIWLLRLGPQMFDPDDAFLQELHRGRYVVRRWQDGPIDIVGLRLPSLAPIPPRAPDRSRR